MTDTDLVKAARELDREARRHKKAASHHRRLAQEARDRQAKIEAQLAAIGITVTYENSQGEGHLHGQRQVTHP